MQKILYSALDEAEPIWVYDDGECRTLAFAPNDAQSCCLKTQPHVLQFDYTQAMLLVLLFIQPKRALVLGLGGGSLITTLHHIIPGIYLTAVELRQKVIDLAYQYFCLPRAKRIEIICDNADNFLSTVELRKVDIVFADLYHAEGIDQVQLRHDFIQRCAANLKEEGWLVLNCWSEHKDDPELWAALEEYFVDLRKVMTNSKNWIVFAGKAKDFQSASELKNKAQHWQNALGFSLLKHLGRLQLA